MTSRHPEPAIPCYSLDRGWDDLHSVFTLSSADLFPAVRRQFNDINWSENWWQSPYHFGVAVGLLVAASCTMLLLSALQAVWLCMAASMRLAITSVMWLAEWFWRWYWKTFSACPACGHSSSLPAFACDHCGVLHRELVPNRFGIFRHQCRNCLQSIPSSMYSGRSRLAAYCPFEDCRCPITHPDRTPVLVALGGGPGHGKTNYLFRSLDSLTTLHAGVRNWNISWPDEAEAARFADLTAQHKASAVRKTPFEPPTAWRLHLQSPKRSVDRMLYVYDPGGESFHEQEALNAHAYYSRIAGAIFVIDPFSLPHIRAAFHEVGDDLADVRPAEENAEICFERLLSVIELHAGNGKEQRHKMPLAIIISKLDARQLINTVRATTTGQTNHEQGVAFLNQYGLDGLLNLANAHFRKVRVFLAGENVGTSCMGEHLDAADPLLWIIDEEEATAAVRR